LLDSLQRQTHQDFRVLLVDQNDDNRVEGVLAARPGLEVERIRGEPGLSRARNTALRRLQADVVAFPDDDCAYPEDLLERVAARFAQDPTLDGITGREPWWSQTAATLTRENLWNRAISFTIFLRRVVVERIGTFDEALGLPASSGEEIDYLIRALDAGARIEYDPALVVEHPRKPIDPVVVGDRDGASVGYMLRKHGYRGGTVIRMLLRPVGGALVSALRGDRRRARFQIATFRGRLRAYRR
jgi:glycosyltransferase involved in cell wall biosynthesis